MTKQIGQQGYVATMGKKLPGKEMPESMRMDQCRIDPTSLRVDLELTRQTTGRERLPKAIEHKRLFRLLPARYRPRDMPAIVGNKLRLATIKPFLKFGLQASRKVYPAQFPALSTHIAITFTCIIDRQAHELTNPHASFCHDLHREVVVRSSFFLSQLFSLP